MDEEVSSSTRLGLVDFQPPAGSFDPNKYPSADTAAQGQTLEDFSPARSGDTSEILARVRGTRLTPIQQAALLQSLLNQRQAGPHTLPVPPGPGEEHQMPFSRIEGLNELQGHPSTSASFSDPLAPQRIEELLQAQTNLDVWASTVFSTGSPGFTTPPLATPSLPTPLLDPSAPTVPDMSTFNWAALYPQPPPASPADASAFPLPHPFPTGLPDFGLRQSDFQPPGFSSMPPQHTSFPSLQQVQDEDDASSRAPSPQPSVRSSRSRRASKAPSRSASEGGQVSDTPSLAAREFMTPEEIEEDKRRRNTEASGPFFSSSSCMPPFLRDADSRDRPRATMSQRGSDSRKSCGFNRRNKPRPS